MAIRGCVIAVAEKRFSGGYSRTRPGCLLEFAFVGVVGFCVTVGRPGDERKEDGEKAEDYPDSEHGAPSCTSLVRLRRHGFELQMGCV